MYFTKHNNVAAQVILFNIFCVTMSNKCSKSCILHFSNYFLCAPMETLLATVSCLFEQLERRVVVTTGEGADEGNGGGGWRKI